MKNENQQHKDAKSNEQFATVEEMESKVLNPVIEEIQEKVAPVHSFR